MKFESLSLINPRFLSFVILRRSRRIWAKDFNSISLTTFHSLSRSCANAQDDKEYHFVTFLVKRKRTNIIAKTIRFSVWYG